MAVLFDELVTWKEIAGMPAGDVATSSPPGKAELEPATDRQPGSRRGSGLSLPAGVHLVLES